MRASDVKVMHSIVSALGAHANENPVTIDLFCGDTGDHVVFRPVAVPEAYSGQVQRYEYVIDVHHREAGPVPE